MPVAVSCKTYGKRNLPRGKGILLDCQIDIFRLAEPASAALDREKEHVFDSVPVLPGGDNVFSTKIAAGTDASVCIVPAQKIPPGRYRVRACGRDDFGQEIFSESEFIVVDPAAKTTPIRKKMLFEKVPTIPRNDLCESVDFIYASGLESACAFVEITETKSRERIGAFYVSPGNEQRKISLPVTAEMQGKAFSVRATQIAENRIFVKRQDFYIPPQKQEQKEFRSRGEIRNPPRPDANRAARPLFRADEGKVSSSLFNFSFYLRETLREHEPSERKSDPASPDWMLL